MDDDFRPLRLDLVEQGKLHEDLDGELGRATRALLDHAKRYGPDAKGAKAELTLKLTFKVEDPEAGTVSIKSLISSKAPGRPATATTAFQRFDKGQPVLVVKALGSDAGDPRQANLRFGNQLEESEPASGEVAPRAKKKELG